MNHVESTTVAAANQEGLPFFNRLRLPVLGGDSPQATQFRQLFEASVEPPKHKPMEPSKPLRLHVKAMTADGGWLFSVSDLESRSLIFRSNSRSSDTVYGALNLGIGWCRAHIPNTAVSVLMPTVKEAQ